jgi:hypothetical protein
MSRCVLQGEIGCCLKGLCQTAHRLARAKIGHEGNEVSPVGKKIPEQRWITLRPGYAGISADGFQCNHQANQVTPAACLACGQGAAGAPGAEERRSRIGEGDEAYGASRFGERKQL